MRVSVGFGGGDGLGCRGIGDDLGRRGVGGVSAEFFVLLFSFKFPEILVE